jgi:hypothetical protein
MRDFLFSEIASIHGFANIPTNPKLAIKAGTKLCEELLESLRITFGEVTIRSAYRSPQVNELGRELSTIAIDSGCVIGGSNL